jgi:opacity protein-like surface antigen
LIGTAGVSWTKATLKLNGTLYGVTGSISDSQSEFGLRAGAGAQYSFTDQVSLRALARYQSMSFDSQGIDLTNHAWIYSAGLDYSF